jgi:hypothetical protein
MNSNLAALGLAASTENGGAALSHAGAVHAMQAAGDRGGALAALSLHRTWLHSCRVRGLVWLG